MLLLLRKFLSTKSSVQKFAINFLKLQNCKTPIGTKSFIPREQDIYCTGCYEDKFATRCVKCTKVDKIKNLNS